MALLQHWSPEQAPLKGVIATETQRADEMGPSPRPFIFAPGHITAHQLQGVTCPLPALQTPIFWRVPFEHVAGARRTLLTTKESQAGCHCQGREW